MDYIINNRQLTFEYQKIKAEYERFCSMTDDEFKKNLPEALHLACFICWVKELPTSDVLSDYGLIHELAHLIHMPGESILDFEKIREQFKTCLELA